MNNKKSFVLSLIAINVLLVLFFIVTVTLPWIITWYVEVRNKDSGLPALIMLTCYPCVPFVGVSLFSLRKLIKNFIAGMVFGDQNIKMLKVSAICCACVSVITFLAGRYYMPFFAISLATAICALILKVVMDIFSAELAERREKLYESVKDEL